jgi:hypothetical protein
MDKFRITDIEAGDIPRVAKYLVTKTAGIYDEAEWLKILEWIWIDNPYARSGDKPLGWSIIDENENICGVLGNIPVQCVVYGELKDSFWATTWFVDEALRNRSLELFMRYMRQQGLLMSNTPNEHVEKLLIKAFKYERADAGWFKGSYLFPLKPVSGFFSATNRPGNFIRKAAVLFSGLLLKIPQAFIFLRLRSNKTFRQIAVERVSDFSAITDEWFAEFSKQHNCVLVRSAEMYHWLFGRPGNIYNAFQISYHNKVQGYLVFKTRQNTGTGFHYIELVDEAILSLPEEVKKMIMAKAYYEVNRIAGNESLLILRSNSETVRSSLRGLFGLPVKKIEKTYFKTNFLKPGDSPFLTSLDGDGIFFK